jgi:DNA-binding CsgD family transcriptional regulator
MARAHCYTASSSCSTPRELEVLKLIAEAHTSKELWISIKTGERHRQNIPDKLGMRDRVELTRCAIRRGLIQPSVAKNREQRSPRCWAAATPAPPTFSSSAAA